MYKHFNTKLFMFEILCPVGEINLYLVCHCVFCTFKNVIFFPQERMAVSDATFDPLCYNQGLLFIQYIDILVFFFHFLFLRFFKGITDMLGQVWYSPYSVSIDLFFFFYLPEKLFITASFSFLRIILTKLILHQKAEKVKKEKRKNKTNIPS